MTFLRFFFGLRVDLLVAHIGEVDHNLFRADDLRPVDDPVAQFSNLEALLPIEPVVLPYQHDEKIADDLVEWHLEPLTQTLLLPSPLERNPGS